MQFRRPRLHWLRRAAIALVLTGPGGVALAERGPGESALPPVLSVSGSYLAGHFAGSSNDLTAAATYYREALKKDPGSSHLMERAFLLATAAGDIPEGIRLAEALLGVDQSHRLATLVLGVEALKHGRYTEARELFGRGSKGPLADLTGTILGAWALHATGSSAEALAAIDGLSGPDWYQTFKWYHSGLIAEAAGQREEAARRLGEAHRQDSGALRIVDAHARTQMRLGRRDQAERILGEFDSVVANHPLLADLRADIRAGREVGPLVATAAEGAAELLYGLGASLGREGGEEIAAIYLQLALHVAPHHPLADFALADLFENMGQREKAIEAFERIPPESPLRRSAQVQIALNLEALEKTEKALETLELLLEADPTNLEAITALGNVLRGRERFAEAARAYSRGIETLQNPERRHWSLFYFRGIAHERSKDWAKAEADFKKALELYPDQPLVLNYLGYSWVDQGVHLDQALAMIRKAVELRPEDGYIVDSLGWAYYKLGRFDDAVVELERAVELRPQDAVINDHLGDAYWMTDRRLEARFQWNRALGLDPEPQDKARIEQKLKEGLRGAAAAEAR